MLRMLKITALLMVLFCMNAFAQELPESIHSLLPADAEIQQAQLGGMMILVQAVLPDTGEVLMLSGPQGGTLSVQTVQEAECDPSAAPVERSRAEELVQSDYPGCCILFARDEAAGKLLGVAAEDFCGTVLVADDRIRFRALQSGEIFRDGRLTMDGALKVLAMHRPEAQFRALELDEDDGICVYEGEALIDGVEYEFELDVSTGRLLEWERD